MTERKEFRRRTAFGALLFAALLFSGEIVACSSGRNNRNGLIERKFVCLAGALVEIGAEPENENRFLDGEDMLFFVDFCRVNGV